MAAALRSFVTVLYWAAAAACRPILHYPTLPGPVRPGPTFSFHSRTLPLVYCCYHLVGGDLESACLSVCLSLARLRDKMTSRGIEIGGGGGRTDGCDD